MIQQHAAKWKIQIWRKMQVDKKQNLGRFIYYFAFNSLHDEKSYLAPHLEVFNPISPGKDTFF